MIRAFFGIAIPPKLTQQLLREYTPLQKICEGNLIGIDPSLFHVTVKFLSTVEPQALALLSDYAHDLAAATEAFSVSIRKINIFPRPIGRVVAAYVTPHPSLLALHQALDSKAISMGLAREGRRYRPHITLGKFNSTPCELPPIPNTDLVLPVTELMLYESRPGANGSHYIPLRRFPLLK